MKVKQLIALASDSMYFSKPLISGLECLGFQVVFCHNAYEVIDQFAKPQDQRPIMLITDGLLAHGEEFSEAETHGGIDTGIALYWKLRGQFPNLPVVMHLCEGQGFVKMSGVKDPKLAFFKHGDLELHKLILSAVDGFKNHS
jgi:hypothetical protein